MIASEKVRRLAECYSDLTDEERHEFVSLVLPSDEAVVSTEWREEINQRARDIDEGRVQLIDGEDFLQRLRAV
jgi:Putative addiction module component